jgi:hypothetical protein
MKIKKSLVDEKSARLFLLSIQYRVDLYRFNARLGIAPRADTADTLQP